ncbi:SDR family oxidoreductase [Streptomyces sp. ISL-66]|uniref:SDR family NAD(P)-dependent oxidoreductase n=1 Tax=Streptomyces sp. ISL-66 TaxID=2819186 RepID=UPI001BE5F9D1|nr:SDR family oxidoreductase [Streptomyces sp. ISL-66]MBT2471459.1 SDR family oxidoreductase [Streptomyces sp. ISL-66]
MRALVIGPGGIGGEVVRALTGAGHEVVVGRRGDPDTVDAAEGLGVKSFPVDVGDPESCKRFVSAVWKDAGPFSAVVNCFGEMAEGPLLRSGPEDLERLFAANVQGVANVCRAVSFRLMKGGGGTIVNVGSAVSRAGVPGLTAYAASKGALVSFGRSLAAELARYRITCNTVLPGFIDSGPTARRTDAWKDAVARHVPLGRLGTPADVAAVVTALVSPSMGYVTGQEFVVDGGWTLGSAVLADDLMGLDRG